MKSQIIQSRHSFTTSHSVLRAQRLRFIRRCIPILQRRPKLIDEVAKRMIKRELFRNPGRKAIRYSILRRIAFEEGYVDCLQWHSWMSKSPFDYRFLPRIR